MSSNKPWVNGIVELLRHAEGHRNQGSDFDRRMALISYDNAIELSVTTYLKLHPIQRGGASYKGEDVTKWLKNFHTKIEFFLGYVRAETLPVEYELDRIIFYHSLRNELYHAGIGVSPDSVHVAGIRSVAFWVCRALYRIDEAVLLEMIEKAAEVRDVSGEIGGSESEFLEAVLQVKEQLSIFLGMLGIGMNQIEAKKSIGGLWALARMLNTELPVRYDNDLERVEEIHDALITNSEVLQPDDLRELSGTLQDISKILAPKLRENQLDAVALAIEKTLQSMDSEDPRIGVIQQPFGTGMTATLASYLLKLLKSPIAYRVPIVVITDREALSEQLYFTLIDELGLTSSLVGNPRNRSELIEWLSKQQPPIVVTNARKLSSTSHPVDPVDVVHLIVAFDVVNPNDIQLWREVLPNARLIGFVSHKPTQNIESIFGIILSKYTYAEAIRDGILVAPFIESRSALSLDINHVAGLDSTFLDSLEEIGIAELRTVQTLYESAGYINALATDIVQHFERRSAVSPGKALILASTRHAAVLLYDEIARIRPGWHSQDVAKGTMKLVLASSSNDSKHFTRNIPSQANVSMLMNRFKDSEDSLRLVIAIDMLTGVEVPALNTIYLARPLLGVRLQQAIGSLRRRDSLVVDYIGIQSELARLLSEH